MENYNLSKILISPKEENTKKISNYRWLHKIFPEFDLLKYKRKFKRLASSIVDTSSNSKVYSELIEYSKGSQEKFKIIFTTEINSGSNATDSLLEEYNNNKFAALKINNFFNTIDYRSMNFVTILNFCRKKSVPIFIYIYRRSESKQLYKLAQDNPDINFVLASMSGIEYIEYYSDMPNNLMCEICNLNLVSDVRLLNVINIFGAEKVIFSFDTNNEETINNYIKRIMNLSIPDKSKTLILSKNINRMF